jgi:hypothetical protein
MGVPFKLHWLPLAEEEVRVTLPPWQKVVGPPAEIVGIVGNALTVMVTLDVEAVHGELLIVHCKTYEPAPPAGVNVAVGFVVLLNCAVDVLGPLTIDHSPVPTVGAFAASITFPPRQTD